MVEFSGTGTLILSWSGRVLLPKKVTGLGIFFFFFQITLLTRALLDRLPRPPKSIGRSVDEICFPLCRTHGRNGRWRPDTGQRAQRRASPVQDTNVVQVTVTRSNRSHHRAGMQHGCGQRERDRAPQGPLPVRTEQGRPTPRRPSSPDQSAGGWADRPCLPPASASPPRNPC